MSYLDTAQEQIEQIRAEHRYREVATHQPENVVDFSSNDYLSLSTDPRVVQALKQATKVGSGGARLLGGRHREHSMLEEELAAWLGRESALLFSSGYHAAIGAVTVLANCVERIYSDELNHASLIDGIRLAHQPRVIYPHAQFPTRGLRRGSSLTITESIFSMDGDAVDLRAMLDDLNADDVLLVDEAHALGLIGTEGAGIARDLDDPRVVVLGTLSKAFGGLGGFIAGPKVLIDLLANTARPFIFDTALPPSLALAARIALSVIRKDDARREKLHENVAFLRKGLQAMNLPTIDSPGPIVPVVLGESERALRVADALMSKRLYVPAIRPPTVPAGTSRLRLSVRSDHSLEQLDLVLRELQRCISLSPSAIS
jgi:8-amino-7-oxononanoate synthase